jgi:hypothetical protein
MIKGQYKLMYFFGYEKLGGQERVELYDVEQDREEMNNLYPANKNIGKTMLDELKAKIDDLNKLFGCVSNELRESRVACCVFRFEVYETRNTLHAERLQLK